jgi:predicted transcriptional regulator
MSKRKRKSYQGFMKEPVISEPVTIEQIAADSGRSVDEARASVARLCEAGVIQQVAPNRYRFLFLEEDYRQ